ncbi:hypothetical protein C5167_017056 [Papaver somniferum]|uniref:Uncharacterized protein n=1 Tax=Papaver somniferum TaxID=3469 RepID=A0A4Y7IIC6_PAPSO|nr:uncharacterized protein LOC113350640 [Papaver somniferum]RZC48633.1 hypothetical protein C5167_017056 [Papaver somniferum]
MEKKAVNTAIITTTNAITSNEKSNNVDNKNGKQKKRSRFQMLKVALFMLRGQSNKKSKPVHVDVASKGIWKKLVCAMRPLHHQGLSNQNSPPPLITGSNDEATILPNVENDNLPPHDGVFSPPMLSPRVYHPDTPSSSSSVADSMSRYASAQDLQELDKNGESNNDDDEYFFGGDEYIDAKAEEFIAQFYEQMRLQQVDLMNRHRERKMKKKMEMEGNDQ